MSTEMSLVSQVQAGAEWLDEHYSGWEDKIDVSCLNLMNPWYCILGQVGQTMAADRLSGDEFIGHTAYSAMLDLHDRSWGWPSDYGLCPPMGSDPIQWIDQAQLVWISEINRRRLGDVE